MNNEKLYAWLAFAAVAVFWGTTFFAIRIGVQSFPPMLMAGFRHTMGGVLIGSYFIWKGYKLPTRAEFKTLAINGVLMLVIGNGLVTWAEIYVSSGLAALICALTPIWIVVLNSFTGSKEKITWTIFAGLTICMAGQVLIFNTNLKDFANPNYTLGIIAIIVANLSWAAGTLYSKNNTTTVHPLFGAGVQMLVAGFILTTIGTAKGEWAQLHPTNEAIYALLYLVVFGSIVGYGAYMYVIKALPTTIVSTYAYINTLVAVLLGWLFLNEELNFTLALAMAITIGGVWLVNKGRRK
jgi:drug/metabolite transporter (DMT)-like permease